MQESGQLFIVPTPIGNLEDMGLRAIRVLKEVAVIAAEDTRHSRKLLNHYDISNRLMSLHDHNEAQRAQQLIKKLLEGDDVALISDAGTPLISDPGYGLVSQCRQAGVNVIPLPGPCAAITALSAAGLATDRFQFEGFLPVKEKAKLQAIESLHDQSLTTVYYEAPRRIIDTVQKFAELLGSSRQLVLAKELTKTFETFKSGSPQEILDWLLEDDNHCRGEFVLMVEGSKKDENGIPEEALTLLKRLMQDLPLKKAAGITAEIHGLKKNELYQIGLELG